MTRHQSPIPTSPTARARVISVAACEPELPPVEITSGTNKPNTITASKAVFKLCHAR